MKRRRLELIDSLADNTWELIYYFNDRVISVIPLGRDPAVAETALVLVSEFNHLQPEE